MQILHVVGARPNFMKVAPVRAALAGRNGVRQILVHTGQHYDAFMSDIFSGNSKSLNPIAALERDRAAMHSKRPRS